MRSVAADMVIARSRHFSLSLPTLDGIGLSTAVLYLVFFGVGFASFTDPDYWWHLRTGEIIVDTLSIPRNDTYSFTAAGADQFNHQWLSQAFIYLSVNSFGYAVTLGFFVTLTLVSFGIMQRLLVRLGTPRAIALGLVVLGMFISAPFWTVRPQLITWFLLALFVNILIERDRPAWILVPLLAVWANLHVGFLLGLGIVGLWFVSRLWERNSGERVFAVWPAAVFVAVCIAATLLNVNGPRPFLQILEYLPFTSGDVAIHGIAELESPDFSQRARLPLLAGILFLIGVALAGGVRNRFALLLAIVFTALALQTVRFQPLFAIAFLPAAGLAVTQLKNQHSGKRKAQHSVINWTLVTAATLTLLIALSQLPYAQTGRQARTDLPLYPAESLSWIQEHAPNANVFAVHMWGGYFINGLHPKGHVFIDGRNTTYITETWENYWLILGADEGWQAALEDSGADVVVVGDHERLASALLSAQGWTRIPREPGVAFFVRDQASFPVGLSRD